MTTITKTEIKNYNDKFRVCYFEFDEHENEERLYWCQDFDTLEEAEARVEQPL